MTMLPQSQTRREMELGTRAKSRYELAEEKARKKQALTKSSIDVC